MNSLFQQLQQPQQVQNQLPLPQMQQNNQKLPILKNNLKSISSLLKSSNPQELIQSMIQNNPQAQNLLQIFQNSNMTPKQFFYQYAQQMGVDPDQFLNSIK
jgi:hypothetical protein